MTIHALVPQCAEPHVLKYSECKIDKIFEVFAAGHHWRGLKALQTPPSPHPDLASLSKK